MKILFLAVILIGGCTMPDQSAMTQAKMEKIVANKVDMIDHKKGYVAFNYNNVKMLLISDVTHDRMRIIAPITEYEKVTPEQKDIIMQANFHQSIDARYAVSNGVLYSAYIHPMSPLGQNVLEDALNQVSNLALSFGDSYSSGGLSFAGNVNTN